MSRGGKGEKLNSANVISSCKILVKFFSVKFFFAYYKYNVNLIRYKFILLQNISNAERIFVKRGLTRKNCSLSRIDYIIQINTFVVFYLVYLSLYFLLSLRFFPSAYNTQLSKRAVSMGKLKSKDKSRSCDKWRTHVPSFHVYYLCPPRRSTPRLENMFSLSS